jgi:hypothetical protein
MVIVLGDTPPAVRIRCQVTTSQANARVNGPHCPTSANTSHGFVIGNPGRGGKNGPTCIAGTPAGPAVVM